MEQGHTEQTPLLGTTAQDARDSRLSNRLARWALFTVSILIFVAIILVALFLPFDYNGDGVQVVPSKLMVKDSKVRIQLGTFRKEGGGQDRKKRKGGLVSDVLIESLNVNALTIHVLEAKVSRDGAGGGGEGGVIGDDGTVIGDGHELVGDEKEPTLMVDRVQSDTGTFLNFFISSPHSQLPDNSDDSKDRNQEHGYGQREREETSIVAGRLRLRIEVPLGFAGELTIDGSVLNIEGSSSLAKARFNLLHLTTDEGDIVLGSDSTGTDIITTTSEPTLKVGHLYARIHQKGSIHINYMTSSERGKPVRANIETQSGDIVINALQTMLSFDVDKEYPVDDEIVQFFSLVTHEGDIRMTLREGESLLGPWYVRGFVMVMARAQGGVIEGRVEIPDLQLLILDAVSDRNTALEVTEKFIGELTVNSSRRHTATVNPFPGSNHILRFSHSERTLKKGKKVRAEDDYLPLGSIHLQAVDGPANVTFV
ncbi:hypothetical protein BG015_005730 [Linnemannia schmuckeri]|uniref:Adhesin domain-containing protein n=1 Tax=Linnemannia schmuckeri TaxID=64567 RepID=A0A9P5VCA7_9FUNG|nr:hypothetical protein BG015_005730 [Linnemannia schmuckeri]